MRKKLKRWLAAFLALALIAGSIQYVPLLAKAGSVSESDEAFDGSLINNVSEAVRGGTTENGDAVANLSENKGEASTEVMTGADVSGNDSDVSGNESSDSGDDLNNALETVVNQGVAQMSVMLLSEGRAADNVRTLDELGGCVSGSYGVTESPVAPTNAGALQISYSQQYAETCYYIPTNLLQQVTEVTVNVSSGTTANLAVKLLDNSGAEKYVQYNYNGNPISVEASIQNDIAEVGIMHNAAGVGEYVFDSITFKTAAGDKVYKFTELTPFTASHNYNHTDTIAGAMKFSFTGQYKQANLAIPSECLNGLESVSVDVPSGTSTGTLALKLLDSSGGNINSSVNSNGQLVKYGTTTIPVDDGGTNVAVLGIMHTGTDAGEYIINTISFKMTDGKTYVYTPGELTLQGIPNGGCSLSIPGAATKLSYTQQWGMALYNIPAEYLGKVTKISLDLASGDASQISFRLYSASDSSSVLNGQYGEDGVTANVPDDKIDEVARFGIVNKATGNQSYVVNSVTFEMKPDESGTPTTRYYTFKDVAKAESYDCTPTVDDNGTLNVSYDKQNGEVKFNLPEGVDGKTITKMVFHVTEGDVSKQFSPRVYADGYSWDNVVIHKYCTDTIDFTAATDAEKQKLAAGSTFYFGLDNNLDGAQSFTVDYFSITAVQTGGLENPPSSGGDTPDPTPVENLTKAVSAGNTGVALPATSANMNSYYKSDNVTYTSDAASGVRTVTYPSGHNQIQFTLSNSVDLTQYNQITFAAVGATKPVKFGLHYWSSETGTIDLWSSASTQPTADGYYTFDLNPELLDKGTTATTISVWSSGEAQTFDFHGVTFENNPSKVFEEIREVTYTADQLTTVAAVATKANGAWTVNFASQDQDVVFNIPDTLDMGKCMGITLHISSINGPINLFVSKDGTKLESYWNTHSANGVVADSSITATGAVNQFGVQAGRENDAFVPGTSITFTGITFLMSGIELENPVVKGNTTICSAGCFDYSSAEKDTGVTATAELNAAGDKVSAEVVTFDKAGLNLIIEIPATVDTKYLKSINLHYGIKQYTSEQARGLFGGRSALTVAAAGILRASRCAMAVAAAGTLRAEAAEGTPGVTVSLLDADKAVIASADSSQIITLSKFFTGAKYLRFTSTGPTEMRLTGVNFNVEVPIVLNGNFEDDDIEMWRGGWSTIEAVSGSNPIVDGISTYGRIYDRTSPYQGFIQDITARVSNGKIYKFAFWAKLSDTYKDADASLREVTFSPYYKDEKGVEQYGLVPGGTYKQSLTAGEWTYFEGTVKIPANATAFVIRIVEQGTNYGQGNCLKGEYYVTGVKMWETDHEDAGAGGGGGYGGGGGDSANTVITKEATWIGEYDMSDMLVNWASATWEKTKNNTLKMNFKNNYDEARIDLPRTLDMSTAAYVKILMANQNVPIAVKLYYKGQQVDVGYYNNIRSEYILVPAYTGMIDAIGIMSLATPNPQGASAELVKAIFGLTQEPAPLPVYDTIIINGDFEDPDLSDWQSAVWGDVSISRHKFDPALAEGINYYATYSKRNSPYQCFSQDISGRVEEGGIYKFSFLAMLSDDYEGAPPEQRKVEFQPYTIDSDGNADYNPNLEGTYSQVLEPGEWTYFEGTYRVSNPNDVKKVFVRILEQGTDYGQGDCVMGSFSVADVKMEVYIPEPPEIDEDVPDLKDVLREAFGQDFMTGNVLDEDALTDIGVEMLAEKHFNLLTPGNAMKPDAMFDYSNDRHTELHTIDFDGESLVVPTLSFHRADELLDKVLEWNELRPDDPIRLRGHVLVWHSQTPEWFFREGYEVKTNADGTPNYTTPEEMNRRLEWYIKSMMEHFVGEDSPYKDLFYGWDVVNEAVSDNGKGYRTDKNTNKESPDDATHGSNSSWWGVYQSNEFIIRAFQYANKYAPADLELYYNDYNECENNKVPGIVALLNDVLAAEGTRIDAMGMQGHYRIDSPGAKRIENAVRAYANVVGKVYITELDVRASGPIGTDESLKAEYLKQAEYYHDIFEMLKTLDGEDGIEIGGISFWGYTDPKSWLQTSSNVGGGTDGSMTHCPLLFDGDYKVKPAYWAFADYSKVDPTWGAEEDPEETAEPEAVPEAAPEVQEDQAVISDKAEKGGFSPAIPIAVGCVVCVGAIAGTAIWYKKREHVS